MRKALIISVLCLSISQFAKADLLGNWHYSKDSGGLGVSNMLKIQFYHKGQDSNPLYTPLAWNIQTADIGSTYHLTSANATSFTDCTAMLTNGVNNDIVMTSILTTGYGSFSSGTESGKFVKSGFVADDFAGYTIQSIALKINNVTFASPGSNPNGDGQWTDFTVDADLQVYGVPEPATFALLGLGAVVIRRNR